MQTVIKLSRHAACCLVLTVLLGACGGGAGDGTGSGAEPQPQTRILASQTIDSTGGSVGVTDPASPIAGTQVVIPPGALAGPTLITIGQVTGATGLPSDVLVAELGPSGMVFSVPVMLTLRYDPAYLSAHGITDPTTLKLVAINSGSANETLRTLAQDTEQQTLTAPTARAGKFGVTGYTLASLAGDYAMNFTMIDARFGPPAQLAVNVADTPYSGVLNLPFPGYGFRAEQGTVSFDGAGNYSWTATRNVAGVSTPVGGSGQYTVSADGRMALDFGLKGGVLAGGSTFVLAATEGVQVIEMGMGLKKGAGFSVASLNGSYAVALYYADPAAGPAGSINLSIAKTPYTATFNLPFPGYALNSELRTMTFDGAGNYSWSGARNTSGATRAVSGSGTYSVAVDGALGFDTGLAGHLLAGASAFILTTPSGMVQMGAGIRKGGNFSTASLAGRYTVAYHYSDGTAAAPDTADISIPATPYNASIDLPFPLYGFNSEVRTVAFDGNGTYTWSGKRNRGGVSSLVSGGGSYSVDAEGTLSMDARVAGNVLDGGSTFILAPASGQGVQIGVGILK